MMLQEGEEVFLSERVTFGPVRRWLATAAVVLLAVAVAPPIGSEVGRYLLFETAQYAILALLVPPLIVLSAPWRLLGLGDLLEKRMSRPQPSFSRVVAGLLPALAVLVVWRIPPLVDALAQHRLVVVLEVVTVVPASVLIWLELVASPPSFPRLSPLGRIPVAAVTMWSAWILAYTLGFASAGSFSAYTHLHGRALGQAADEQLAAGLLWLAATVTFIPVLFSCLMGFLRSEERRAKA